jgi:hypothetical protein
MFIKTVGSFEEIKTFISGLGHPLFVLQFRGQVCNSCDWKLRPSIIHQRNIDSVEGLLKEESRFINTFKERITSNSLIHRILQVENPIHFQNEWQWLIQAQHYGLPTRLLDWSLDWQRALYFSIDDPDYDDADGQLWIYRCPNGMIYPETSDGFLTMNPVKIDAPSVIIPSYHILPNQKEFKASENAWHQMSRFLVQSDRETLIPLENNPFFKDILVKLVIPGKSKADLRDFIDPAKDGRSYFYGEPDKTIEVIVKDLKRFRETI